MHAAGARLLVIGGSDQMPYDAERFFQVGGHARAAYGAGRDWDRPEFWYGLIERHADAGFAGGFFDRGSESWCCGMSDETLGACALAIALLTHRVLIEASMSEHVPGGGDGFEGLRATRQIRGLLEREHGFQASGFVRLDRGSILILYARGAPSPVRNDRLWPMAALSGLDRIPSVTVIPYRETEPVHTIAAEVFLRGV